MLRCSLSSEFYRLDVKCLFTRDCVRKKIFHKCSTLNWTCTLFMMYTVATLILVTDQTPGPNIRCELDFVDSVTHEINEN